MRTSSGKGFILVVEDDAEACAALVSNLASNGYSSSAVTTVSDATHVLSKARPDVVVLDLGLPDGDGTELLRHLDDVPVCVVSGKTNARELAHDADMVFAKPVRLEELLGAIEALKHHRAGAKRARNR